MRSDKKMAIMVISVFVLVFAFVTPASAIQGPCCTNVSACNLTELLATVNLSACWDDYTGDENFELMIIDDKNATWVPVDGCPYGLVGYYNYTEENTLKGVVEVWGLTPNANHQITLNGPGINGTGFSISEETDSALASGVYTTPAASRPLSFNAFERGYWNSGPYLDTNRGTSNYQGQGIYNFGMNVTTDDCGHFCYDFNITLPSGKYEGVKFIVKECTAGDGDCYNLTPGQWVPRLMECVAMEFIISPSGNAADDTLVIKDVYTVMESVYAVGHNFAPNKSVDIYITPVRTWADGDNIAAFAIVGPVPATSDANGDIGIDPKVLMWENPTPGQYQMVFDDPDELFTRGIDIADFFEVLGVAAPVLTPIGIVALVGLLSIIATSTLVIRKKRR